MELARPSRRERERARHREEILAAARELLACRGIVGVTVEAIAKASEFAVGSIYRHFGSKEELLEVLILDLARPFFEEVDRIAAGDGPFEAKLDAFLDRYVVAFEASLPEVRLLLSGVGSWPSTTGARQARITEAVDRYLGVVARLVRAGVDDGTLAGDPEALALGLVGIVDTFGRTTAMHPERDLRAGLYVVRRLFLDGARRRADVDG
jgi:AcrR family transcriptional regulator